MKRLMAQRQELDDQLREMRKRRAMHLQVLSETRTDEDGVADLKTKEADLIGRVNAIRTEFNGIRRELLETRQAIETKLEQYLPDDLR